MLNLPLHRIPQRASTHEWEERGWIWLKPQPDPANPEVETIVLISHISTFSVLAPFRCFILKVRDSTGGRSMLAVYLSLIGVNKQIVVFVDIRFLVAIEILLLYCILRTCSQCRNE